MKTKRQRMLQYFKSQIQNIKVTDFVYITVKTIHYNNIFMKYARKMHISKPSLFLLSAIKLIKQSSVTDRSFSIFMARSTKGSPYQFIGYKIV